MKLISAAFAAHFRDIKFTHIQAKNEAVFLELLSLGWVETQSRHSNLKTKE